MISNLTQHYCNLSHCALKARNIRWPLFVLLLGLSTDSISPLGSSNYEDAELSLAIEDVNVDEDWDL